MAKVVGSTVSACGERRLWPERCDREDQQQMLRATFPGVRDAVRELLSVRMDALARRFHETHDAAVKDEIYRLARDMGRSRSRGFLTGKASTWSLSDTIVISPARLVALHPQPLLASPE